MDNIIENIDSIKNDLESKVSEYMNIEALATNQNGTSEEINIDIANSAFLQSYPQRKPFEEIISVPIKF